MQLTMPAIDLPWRRKTPIERAQAELHKTAKEIGKQTEKIELPKIELPQVKAEDLSAAVEDTKKAVGTGMDQLSITAGQIGREAGLLGRKAAKRASELNVKGVRADLKGLTDDVRSLRVTRAKRGPDMMPGIALLAGLGAGMAAMYFFDPEQGRRRRALLRDQLMKWSRVTRESLDGQMKDLRNRSVGLAHEVRRGVEGATSGAEDVAMEDLASATPDASGQLAGTDQAVEPEPVTQAVGGGWSDDQPEAGRAH